MIAGMSPVTTRRSPKSPRNESTGVSNVPVVRMTWWSVTLYGGRATRRRRRPKEAPCRHDGALAGSGALLVGVVGSGALLVGAIGLRVPEFLC